MWKTLADWLQAFLNMTRELQEHRVSIRHLEDRLRDLETAVKLLAQEQRHAREFEAASREKLLLQIQQELGKRKSLPAPVLPRKKK
jgi:hypothetical protein